MTNDNKMWGAITQLAKREKNKRARDLTLSVGVSSSGPAALKLSLRSNSFSSLVGYGTEPVEINNARIESMASSLRNNFGNAIDLLK